MNIRSTETALDWLLSTVKRNPEGLLLLGAGAVLLMRQGSGARASSTSVVSSAAVPTGGVSTGAVSGVAEKASQARDAAAQLTDDTLRGASQLASSATDLASSATDYAKQATRRAGEQSAHVMEQAQATVQKTFSRIVEEQPLAIALAGIATGAAIASVFPTTAFEKQKVGPIASDVSQAGVEKIKDAAETVGETLKDAAEERGLTGEGLKEVAAEVVEAVKSSDSGRGGGQDRPPGA
jgi:hypothetical protein